MQEFRLRIEVGCCRGSAEHTWSSGWKLMLRSGVRVASSQSCCRRVVGLSNFRHTGTPACRACLSGWGLARGKVGRVSSDDTRAHLHNGGRG